MPVGNCGLEIELRNFYSLNLAINQEYNSNLMHTNEAPTSAAGQRLPGFVDYQGIGMHSQTPGETKWFLGLQVCIVSFRVPYPQNDVIEPSIFTNDKNYVCFL